MSRTRYPPFNSFRRPLHFVPVPSPPDSNPTPILFAVVGVSDQVTIEAVELPRTVIAQVIQIGRTEGFYYAKALNLSGLAKLESFTIQRLEKDLRQIIERSDDASFKEAVSTLMPLVSKVASNRELSLWVDAGR